MRDDPTFDTEQEPKIREDFGAPPEELTSASQEACDWPKPAPAHATIIVPAASASVLAVVDKSGFLVPVFTASDLLRGFKAIWRGS